MISYRKDFGLWWPDYDDRAESTHRTLMNHAKYAEACVRFARGRRCAVQAGGFVGVWPLRLKSHFAKVVTFEPDRASYEALLKNCEGTPEVRAHYGALHSVSGTGYMLSSKCSCWKFTWDKNAKGIDSDIATNSIDDLGLQYCDAIVLDTEGSELAILKGARKIIALCRPVIQLEVWPENDLEYNTFMKTMDYEEAARAGHDVIYVPSENYA